MMIGNRTRGVLCVLMAGVLAASGVAAKEEAAAKEEGTAPAGVKVYGKADVSAESLSDGRQESLYLSSNASRFGLRGKAPITERLAAVAQVELGVRLDDSTAGLSLRNSFVGLTGCGGTLLAGRHDTAVWTLGRSVDIFSNRIGDTRNITGKNGYGGDKRVDGALVYKSPSIAGIDSMLVYATEDGSPDTGVASAGIRGKAFGVSLGAGYEEHGRALTPIDTNADGTNDAPSTVSESMYRFVASCDCGMVRLTGLYEILLDVAGESGADREAWGAGVACKLSKATLKSQYYDVSSIRGKPDTGADMIVGGVDYRMASHTTLYATYATTRNDAMSALTMSAGGHGDRLAAEPGDMHSGVALGMIHKF